MLHFIVPPLYLHIAMDPSCCCTPKMFISAIRWSLESPEDTPGPAIVAALLRALPAKILSYNIADYPLYILSLVRQYDRIMLTLFICPLAIHL